MRKSPLPIGKLPPDLLVRLLKSIPVNDQRVVIGPGSGLDCAVIEMGERLLVLKSDPVTFASDAIGWYAVQINANDIATSGGTPRWFLATCLLPAGTCEADIGDIARQLRDACNECGVTLVGGHTEITHGIDHPILCGTMIGEVAPNQLVTSRGAQRGDAVLLTKGIPIETVALLAREFPERIRQTLGEKKLAAAAAYLRKPGISILKDARIAIQAGTVNAMHDPTEGGLAAALWELADASDRRVLLHSKAVHIPELARELCELFDLDPLACLASGALLLTTPVSDAPEIIQALHSADIRCDQIGLIDAGHPAVIVQDSQQAHPLERPQRDAIGRLFERFP